MKPAEGHSSGTWTHYHALAQCLDDKDHVDVVADQFASWLREKHVDLDVRHDNEHQTDNFAAHVRYHERDGGEHDLQATLVEQSPLGDWTSMVTASADGWIEIDVRNSEGRFVDVPRIARYLMQSLELGDSGLEFSDGPQIWGRERVPDLVELLTRRDRHAPVFVAAVGAEGGLATPFIKRVGTWARQTYGLAQTIVLRHEAAVAAAEPLGKHSVPPWTIRTFLPGVDIDDSRDSFRHRWLSTASLAHLSDARIARTLGTIARSQTELRPLPAHVTRLHRTFERLSDREVSDAVRSPVALSLPTRTTPAPASREKTHPDPASAYEQLELVKEVFGLDEIDRTALTAIAEAATAPRLDVEAADRLDARLESLRNDLADRDDAVSAEQRRADDHEIAAAIAETEAADARSEALWLRRQLQEQGAHEIAWSAPPEPSRPADMLELVASLPERVIFTGDTKDVEDVVERDGLQTCTVVAWDAVNAMHDYLRARDAEVVDCSFHRYLFDTPSGYRTLSPSKSA